MKYQNNNKRKTLGKNLLRFGLGELGKRNSKYIPFLQKAHGILYGIEIKKKDLNELNIEDLNKKENENFYIDKPNPESSGILNEERKKIIFHNFIENDYFIGQFILKTQTNMIKNIKLTNSYFDETTFDIYDVMINLKEGIANYCLVIKLYLIKGKYNEALELFLLMTEKNKKFIEYIFKRIKAHFPKISNSNRIGKFFPAITKKYCEILSCLIKLSEKFNKPKIHSLFMKYYIKTFYLISKIVNSKFLLSSDMNNKDPKINHISKYLYSTIFFDIGIFYFLKYKPLIFIINILRHVLELYKNNIFDEILTIEKILLLKTNYDLGLFLYVDGKNKESIQHLLDAKNILSNIKILSPLKENKTKKMPKAVYSENSFLSLLNKNILSNSSKGDNENENKNIQNLNLNYIHKKSSFILFGSQLKNLEKQYDKLEDIIYNKIELILAEIELNTNGHMKVIHHINRLLINKNNTNKNDSNLRKRSGYSKLLMGKTYIDFKEKEDENNKCNYQLLNDFDKRKIMFLLEKIGNKKLYKNNSMDNIYKSKIEKNFEKQRYYISKEMEKFFIFLCGLSLYQLEILNETQPKSSLLRNNLPIVITNQFKDCLTNSQRMNLIHLESMDLLRYIILKNPNEYICPDNLDYLFMKYKIKDMINEKCDKEKIVIQKKDNNMKINKSAYQRNKLMFIGNNFSQTFDNIKTTDYKQRIEFNKMLDSIINEKNKVFINMFRESILNVLINLNNKEKQLFMKSKTLLKDLIKKIESGMSIKKK